MMKSIMVVVLVYNNRYLIPTTYRLHDDDDDITRHTARYIKLHILCFGIRREMRIYRQPHFKNYVWKLALSDSERAQKAAYG